MSRAILWILHCWLLVISSFGAEFPQRNAHPDLPLVYNVLVFGASGDGRTDNVVPLSRAIAGVCTSGGVIFFPAGVYSLSQALLLEGCHGVTLRGVGPIASTLRANGSDSSLLIFNQSSYCGVENLSLTGLAAQLPVSTAALLRYTGRHPRYQSSPLVRTTSPSITAPVSPCNGSSVAPSIIMPISGSAVAIIGSFSTFLKSIVISGVWAAVTASHMANTITMEDCIVLSVFGPSAVSASGGSAGLRVDILQMIRVTMNQQHLDGSNSSVVWIDIGAGVNTVRLSNVGLIQGGTAVRMSSPADAPPGVFPGRPLFVFCDDLEIDFPMHNAVSLERGESFLCSNCYVQGSTTANGIFAAATWNSELQITNSRIFGHAQNGVLLLGGRRTILSGNIVGDNAVHSSASGVVIGANVSNFIISGCQVGPVFGSESASRQTYGIVVLPGTSDAYSISNNVLVGNAIAGLRDGGAGLRKSVLGNVE